MRVEASNAPPSTTPSMAVRVTIGIPNRKTWETAMAAMAAR